MLKLAAIGVISVPQKPASIPKKPMTEMRMGGFFIQISPCCRDLINDEDSPPVYPPLTYFA